MARQPSEDDAEQAGGGATPKAEPKTEAEAPATRSETPSTQDQPSEPAVSSAPTTPSSAQPPKVSAATPNTPAGVKPAVPAVPVVPALPKASSKETKPSVAPAKTQAAVTPAEQPAEAAKPAGENVNGSAEAAQPAPAWTKPKLWAGLFAKSGSSAASTSAAAAAAHGQTNGNVAEGSTTVPGPGGFAKANANSLAQAVQAYRPGTSDRLAFLEPRGLVNTGNMCYMNSVSTTPFLTPLDCCCVVLYFLTRR